MKKINYSYLKVKNDRLDYLGERYFRFSFECDSVLQICVSHGEDRRRGKGNSIGIYMIARMTMLSNYHAMDYLETITKRQFDSQFKKVVNWLT